MAAVPLDPGKLYKGPLYFLVDRACGSSCESMLEIFKAHPRTRVIGENTAGAIHFCPVDEHLVLPNSQIHVEMSDQYNHYADGRFVEKNGYAPDVRVPAGQDAMAVALDLLQKALDQAVPAP
jgi:C-terminal processing protease CtpA/Prc